MPLEKYISAFFSGKPASIFAAVSIVVSFLSTLKISNSDWSALKVLSSEVSPAPRASGHVRTFANVELLHRGFERVFIVSEVL